MNIVHTENGLAITLSLEGKLTNDSVEPLERVISEISNDVEQLIFDCRNLTFISSAGFRILIAAHRRFTGRMSLLNLNKNVYKTFEMTGLIDILTIK